MKLAIKLTACKVDYNLSHQHIKISKKCLLLAPKTRHHYDELYCYTITIYISLIE